MKRYQFLLAILFSITTTVLADNPHFVGKASASCANGVLTVCFHEAGLGSTTEVHYTLSADAVVERTCQNPASHKPPGLQRFSTHAAGEGTLSQTSPGNIQGCIPTTGDSCAVPEPCPPPMDQTLTCKFTNIALTDSTNGKSINVAAVTCP